MEIPDDQNTKYYGALAVDIALKIGLLAILIYCCFHIISPFIKIMLCGIIIAVTVFPIFAKLTYLLGNRVKLAAVSITLALIITILLPTAMLTGSLVDGAHLLRSKIDSGIAIPAPPESAGQWPIIGRSVENTWMLASQNMEAAVQRFEPQLKSFSVWLVGAAVNSGMMVLKLLASIIVAGVLLPNAEREGKRSLDFFSRLAGERSEEFVNLTVVTLRNVARGILGVAILQALTAGIGCAVADVPAAGLWALLCFFLAIIQIGIFPVTIPIIIYMFYHTDTITAVILAVWLSIITASDNFLKPVLLGRGAPVPMLVIFLGAIGGFITMGFLGMFIGAVVISASYVVFDTWLAGTDGSQQLGQ